MLAGNNQYNNGLSNNLRPTVKMTDVVVNEPEDRIQDLTMDKVPLLFDLMDIDNNYMEKNPSPLICKTPKLPENTKTKFPPPILEKINYFRNRSNEYKSRDIKKKEVEKYLLDKGTCDKINPEIFRDSRLRLFNLDDVTLNDKLATVDTLDASIHDNLSCAVDTVIYDGSVKGNLAPLPRERIRNWFPEIRQIGLESVEGYALRTSFTTNSNLFVVKAPRNPNNDDLMHEAIVGFYALNKLRHVIPNYMYVYGYTKCSPPSLQNKTPVTWCSSSNPGVSYLITENIQDGIPFSDWIVQPNITLKDFIAVILQVFNALNLGYKYYGYTHYDLHHGNVMVRRFDKVVAIPYFGNHTTVQGYIASSYVPYIIDYGYSRITIGGVGFGKIGLEDYGIEGDQPFPMYDVYKLLGFLSEKVYLSSENHQNINDIRNALNIMFSFFNEGNVRDRVQKRLNGKDWYNCRDSYRNITHDNYLLWLETKSGINLPIGKSLSALISKGVYAAPINTSMDTCTFYNMVSNNNGPQTSLEYCEVVNAINQDSSFPEDVKKESLKFINHRFDSDGYFQNNLQELYNKIAIISDLYKKNNMAGTINTIPYIKNSPNFNTREFLDIYRKCIIDTLKIKDLISEIVSFIKASICSLVNQGKYDKNKPILDPFVDAMNKWQKFILEQRKILAANVQYSKTINWSAVTTQKDVFYFWTKEHEILALAL